MRSKSLSILLIEDNPGDVRLVIECLSFDPHISTEIQHVETLSEALEALDSQPFDVILLDLSLPDVHGLDTLRELRPRTKLPIVVLTGVEDDRLGLAALQEGAQDYLVKGEIPGSLLIRSIRYAIERLRTLDALRRSEERYELAMTATQDGIWDWDLLQDTIEYSARWKAMLGYQESDLDNSPDTWFSHIYPSDLNALQERLNAYLTGHASVFECEYRMRHRDGEMRWMLARGVAISDGCGKHYRMVGSQSDITDRKQVEMRMERAAYRDPLTGLDNRAQIRHSLEQALAASTRRQTGVGVLFLDLDNFKTINDTLGHSAGDHVLCVIARRLTVEVREYDRIARFGGDEFMILIDDLEDVSQAEQIAKRVLDAIVEPIRLQDNEATLSASIGITVCMTGQTDPEYLLQAADVAMYHAKGSGKNGIAVFDPSMMNTLVERIELERLLRKALRDQRIQLKYQPIVDLETSHIIGVEALARLNDEDTRLVLPGVFIPTAEATGLIVPLGEAVLERALLDTKQLQTHQPDLNLSVNISATQLQHDDFVERLFQILDQTGFDPNRLTLEITETSVMTETLSVIKRLQEIKQRGIVIAIDDFGTGHSSLSVLRELPIDILKIDRTFVGRMNADLDGIEIVRLITVMARALSLSVVAEGIETVEQLVALRDLNCQLGQGFLISRPVDAAEIETMLNEHGQRLEPQNELVKAPASQQVSAG